MTRTVYGASLTLAAAAIALVTRASAQQDSEPVAVAYEAPIECPDAAAFFREITGRTARARSARMGEPARVIHLVVSKQGGALLGRFWIDDTTGSSTVRRIEGASCGEIVGAAGLVAALAVDPRASTEPRAAPVAPTSAAASPAAGSTGGASASPGSAGGAGAATPAASSTSSTSDAGVTDAAPPTDAAPSDAGPATPAAAPAAPKLSSAPATRTVLWSLGLDAEMTTVAGVVPSGRLFGEARIAPNATVLSPSIRLAVARSLEVDRSAAIGSATLAYTVGSLEVCLLRAPLATSAALLPCVGGGGGVLSASGQGLEVTENRIRPWAWFEATGRAVWEPGALGLELEAGAMLPLYRESFFFQPSVPVYEAPAVAFVGRAGLVWRFP